MKKIMFNVFAWCLAIAVAISFAGIVSAEETSTPATEAPVVQPQQEQCPSCSEGTPAPAPTEAPAPAPVDSST